MRINYEFADGSRSTVNVSEELGNVIAEMSRKEDNLSRKERYHCCSYDAADYEGTEFSDFETPETIMEDNFSSEHISKAFSHLSDVQKRRLIMLAEGMSMREIAKRENKDISSIRESIAGARKNFLKNF